MLAKFEDWHRRVDTWGSFLASVIVGVMMFLTAADVFGRYLFKKPVIGTFEMMEFLLVGAAYFALAYTQMNRQHIMLEFVIERLPKRGRFVLSVIMNILILPVLFLLTWQSTIYAIHAWTAGEHTAGLVAFQLGPPKMFVPIGLFLLSVRMLTQLVGDLLKLVKREAA